MLWSQISRYAVSSQGSHQQGLLMATPSFPFIPGQTPAWFLFACQGGLCISTSTRAPRLTSYKRNQLPFTPSTLHLKGDDIQKNLRKKQHNCSCVDKDFCSLMDLHKHLFQSSLLTVNWKWVWNQMSSTISTIISSYLFWWVLVQGQEWTLCHFIFSPTQQDRYYYSCFTHNTLIGTQRS